MAVSMTTNDSPASTIRLAQTGFPMPILGFGVFENDECKPACLTALRHGYRHIDTARYYHNERHVGAAVKESGIDRKDVFITSKIYHPDFGYESTVRCVQESVNELGYGYYDLYLLHSPLSGKERRLETYRALLECQSRQLIKTVGVSNYGIKHLEEIKEAGYVMPAVNQIEVHPFCQQRPIIEYCHANDIVVQAYSPLVRNLRDDPSFHEIAKEYAKSPAQVLIRWSLQKGLVPLPKSSNRERIVANANVFDFNLDQEIMDRLDALDEGGKGAVTWNPVDAQ